MDTIAQAKKFLRANFDKPAGVKCPCCGQHVKLYKRKLNREMAAWLGWLVSASEQAEDGWVDVKASPVRGGDYAKISHWGLIEQKPNDDPKKKQSGIWRPTTKGKDFVSGKLRLPSHVLLFDNREYGWSEKLIHFDEALGRDFVYKEILDTSEDRDDRA